MWQGSTDDVLVMEHVQGVSVGGALVASVLSQSDKNAVRSFFPPPLSIYIIGLMEDR